MAGIQPWYGVSMSMPLHDGVQRQTPEILIQRRDQEDSADFERGVLQMTLYPLEEVDDAALTGKLQEIANEIENQLRREPNIIHQMIKIFMEWRSHKSPNRVRPTTFQELFKALEKPKKVAQLLRLQALLYKAHRKDLCTKVEDMVRRSVESGRLRIACIHYGDRSREIPEEAPAEAGFIQVFAECEPLEVDLELERVLGGLAALLRVPHHRVSCSELCCGSGFWITVMAPLWATEALHKESNRHDVQVYLGSLGIKEIIFLAPREPTRKRQRQEEDPEMARVPKSAKVHTEPGPGTSTEKKPKWMSWSETDVFNHFSKISKSIAGLLKGKVKSGKDMAQFNPDELLRIGLQKEDLKTMKKEMQEIGVYEASLTTKIMNDPVHSHMEFHPLCVKIIDTPEFQRLRNIKQLGTVYLVYPGAAHNRFEHSLGVGHLAGRLVKSLKKRQPELGITDEDVLCVTIAGLCHDLGHGPHSHTFEEFMKEAQPELGWEHEDSSVMMFNQILERDNLRTAFTWYGLDEDDLEFIRQQIKGKKINKEGTKKREDKQFLLEIVANRRNGIDVDKWDYIARDCLMLGIPNSFDYERFLKHARVILCTNGWEICSRDKEAEDLYKMFQTRHFLNRRAYQHKTQQGIEAMLVDVLLLVEESGQITFKGKEGKRLRISECVKDPIAFTSLDDSVFSLIQQSSSPAPKIREAQGILDDIRNRRFYKLVGETDPTDEPLPPSTLKELLTEKMDRTKIVVKEMYIDYGLEKKNPILETHFYKKSDPFKAVTIRKEQISLILPDHFSEYIVRLYCKQTDHESMASALEHFKKWCGPPGLRLKESFSE